MATGTTNVAVPDALHLQLRGIAKEEGRTISYLVRVAISRFLDGRKKAQPANKGKAA